MSKKGREITDYLNDILGSINDVKEFVSGMTYDAFAADKKTVNAVIRSLEVLGEATKHVPASFRNRHPNIPWNKMAGMRDVLIHDYMGVDLKTVWKVAQERLPEIKPLVEGVVSEKGNE
ncbi:HepT-like ribonuclease domain-containing protein [Geobacter pickeringii]|uniref:DUF86 domain-containing protein n=1 Tax=Geobacter pickeringii TaxID=345632 RepID=A0A0B5BCC6_9BACT|nr:DUF86 domain-containing protein [Geobacter pickeringii]AJE02230.1 hypothetical protein GPICK_01520 [Geobacter pickeringii]